MNSLMFKPDLTLANLEGRKTRTSRTRGLDKINEHPDDWEEYKWLDDRTVVFKNKVNKEIITLKCPYGEINDVLYGKETYAPVYKSVSHEYPNEVCYFQWNKEIHGELTSKTNGLKIFYKADNDVLPAEFSMGEIKWKSPMMMPEVASRYHLIIDGIGLQRIQSITPEDCIKEGIDTESEAYCRAENHQNAGVSVSPEKYTFGVLWDSINHNWNLNPWSWYLYYHVVKK